MAEQTVDSEKRAAARKELQVKMLAAAKRLKEEKKRQEAEPAPDPALPPPSRPSSQGGTTLRRRSVVYAEIMTASGRLPPERKILEEDEEPKEKAPALPFVTLRLGLGDSLGSPSNDLESILDSIENPHDTSSSSDSEQDLESLLPPPRLSLSPQKSFVRGGALMSPAVPGLQDRRREHSRVAPIVNALQRTPTATEIIPAVKPPLSTAQSFSNSPRKVSFAGRSVVLSTPSSPRDPKITPHPPSGPMTPSSRPTTSQRHLKSPGSSPLDHQGSLFSEKHIMTLPCSPLKNYATVHEETEKDVEPLTPFGRDLLSVNFFDDNEQDHHSTVATPVAPRRRQSHIIDNVGSSADVIFNATARTDFFSSARKMSQAKPSTADSSRAYINACDRLHVSPRPLPLLKQALSDVRLQYFGLNAKSCTALAESLKSNSSMAKSLSLCDNRIGSGGCTAIAEMLRVNRGLTELDLSNNAIDTLGVMSLVRVFSDARVHNDITTLVLAGNHFGDRAVGLLCTALKENTQITSLDLRDNHISSDGASSLAVLCEENNRIKTLNLGWNSIRGRGASELGVSLSYNRSLTSLSVAWNGMGSSGMQSFAESLEGNSNLEHFDLGYNRISDQTCLVLAYYLTNNTSLLELGLDGNPLGVTGFWALLRSVLVPESDLTRQLSLDSCKFSSSLSFSGVKKAFDIEDSPGVYSLDLSSIEQRIAAVEVWRAADHDPQRWKNATLDKKNFVFPVPVQGLWDPPTKGLLEVELCSAFPKPHERAILSEVTFQALKDLLVQAPHDVIRCVHSVLNVTCQQLIELLNCFRTGRWERIDLCAALLPRTTNPQEIPSVISVLTAAEANHVQLLVGELTFFDFRHPCGHYRLSSKQASDLHLAHCLFGVTRSPEAIPNMTLLNLRVNGRVAEDWTLSATPCVLEFDVLDLSSIASDVTAVTDSEFEDAALVITTYQSQTDQSQQRVSFLKMLKPLREGRFTSEQLFQLALAAHHCGTQLSLDVISALFSNVTDIPFFFSGLKSAGFSESFVQQSINRLGWENVWNPTVAEGRYEIDLGSEDNRVVALDLFALSEAEEKSELSNLTWNARPLRVPPEEWFAGLPVSGVLGCSYQCDVSTVNVSLRRELMRKRKWYKRVASTR